MAKTSVVLGVGALVGCAAAPSANAVANTAQPASGTAGATAPGSPATKTARQLQFEAENLQRLQALQVFTVPQLIQGQPDEAFRCYGPCSRLGKFVDMAANAALGPAPAGACDEKAIDANLAAIEALKIVHVDGLLVEKPKNNPSCYNNPCAEDVSSAREVTCSRAGKLANIAAATKGL